MARAVLFVLTVFVAVLAVQAAVLKDGPRTAKSSADARVAEAARRERLVDEIRRQQELLELSADHLGDDTEEHRFRRLLEKFVYALNVRTIVGAMRDTITGEITPAHIIAKTNEVLGEASSLAIGIVQFLKNMGPLTFKIFMHRILTGEEA
ncbi:uncharacterized protein LOC119398002 [Rhipicephalus sanguineus]|uniref:Secreted protein n=1 Tax=Rhipicephalus sanguineus TaxID=34632 RepID=A0A9D4SUW0_RHISA|nr:uncharacterized protein LOC119398002 [Rhipicephalus sanguineus]KAH7948047.1 hypothetical protein HPB52_018041 [Rhipicephalus sanguineus]